MTAIIAITCIVAITTVSVVAMTVTIVVVVTSIVSVRHMVAPKMPSPRPAGLVPRRRLLEGAGETVVTLPKFARIVYQDWSRACLGVDQSA